MKKTLIFLLIGLLILIAFVFIRAETSFEDSQLIVDYSHKKPFKIDQQSAVERFATAIQFATISYDDPSRLDNEPSAVSPTDSLGFQLIEKNIRMMDQNILVAPYLVMGGTDAKHFYGLSDNVYRFMMVELNAKSIKRFHGVNEQLAVKDYIAAVEFFYSMLLDAGKG